MADGMRVAREGYGQQVQYGLRLESAISRLGERAQLVTSTAPVANQFELGTGTYPAAAEPVSSSAMLAGEACRPDFGRIAGEATLACSRFIDIAASCPTCGQVYMIDSVFCPHCGRKRDLGQEPAIPHRQTLTQLDFE